MAASGHPRAETNHAAAAEPPDRLPGDDGSAAPRRHGAQAGKGRGQAPAADSQAATPGKRAGKGHPPRARRANRLAGGARQPGDPALPGLVRERSVEGERALDPRMSQRRLPQLRPGDRRGGNRARKGGGQDERGGGGEAGASCGHAGEAMPATNP